MSKWRTTSITSRYHLSECNTLPFRRGRPVTSPLSVLSQPDVTPSLNRAVGAAVLALPAISPSPSHPSHRWPSPGPSRHPGHVLQASPYWTPAQHQHSLIMQQVLCRLSLPTAPQRSCRCHFCFVHKELGTQRGKAAKLSHTAVNGSAMRIELKHPGTTCRCPA